MDSTALQWTPRRQESLSAAELMWVDIIHCVINQTRFDLSLGDLDYVLRNMIAKMISSASHYKLSRGGLSAVQALNLDITAPIRIKKFIYGKSRPTLLEHVIPRSVLRDEILNSSRTKNDIIRILCASGGIVIVHREEDRKLTENGLRRRMPKSWRGIGDNPFKRYEAAGIYMSDVQIENCGPICL